MDEEVQLNAKASPPGRPISSISHHIGDASAHCTEPCRLFTTSSCSACLQEYGLPSSHTMNTLCLNYMFVWYLLNRELIAPGTAAVLYCLVALWVGGRCLQPTEHINSSFQ